MLFLFLSVLKNRLYVAFFIPFFMLRAKKTLHLKFIDDTDMTCKDFTDFYNETMLRVIKQKLRNVQIEKNLIKFEISGKKVTFWCNTKDKKEMKIILGAIFEEFLSEEWKSLIVKNKVVVDIGASIGDSAIYFVLKGAKHIYALEPYPYSYELGMKNVALNNVKSKVSFLNEAIGGGASFVTIDESYKNTPGDELKTFEKGTKIKVTTLDDLVKRFDLKHAILKIDCEGGEYDAILNTSNSTLALFDQIMIEYHHGYVNLEKKLRGAGFSCRHTIPVYHYNKNVKNKHFLVGFIHAKKPYTI